MQTSNVSASPVVTQAAAPQITSEFNKAVSPAPPIEKTAPVQTDDGKGLSSNKKKGQAPSPMEEMKDMVEFINDQINNLQTNIGFTINEKYDNQIIVEVKDKKTDEVIKQIPSEEFLKIKEKMEDLIGIIFSGIA